ncbi:hypothetical protein BD410DRAFT_648676 [Rickenella mellea]|uniref:Uncharacterized protein n=1 Tax=Rickenella mellea TaxID=50990 RepID=A0A4Y7PL11_9AGAM|nr:hypothetical protein BD410DRAFT_648676 [Rickenella mellea]
MEMRKLGLRNGLGYFILRDGTIYFLAQLLFGVVSIIVFLVPASGTIGNWLGVAGQVTNSLTVILINRLVLNLRQVSHFQDGKPPTLGTIGTIQEPAFAANSLLGNLGAPLRVDPEDEEEPEEVGVDDEAGIVEEHGFVDHGGITEEPRGPSDA